MTRSDRTVGPTAVVLVSLLGCLMSARARAEAGAGDEAAAHALFVDGRKLAAGGDYAAACVKFEDSYRLLQGIGTSFNLADCEEHLGRTASAWARFLDVATATQAAGQPERERIARARAAALEPRLSRLVINVRAPLPELVVRRDGLPVPPAQWGVATPVDPGEHVIAASAPGRRAWSSTVVVPATATEVPVDVPALDAEPRMPEAAPAPALTVSAPPPPPTRAPSILRSIPRGALWVGAVGAAALATGAVFALQFQMNNDQAEGLCTLDNNTACPNTGDLATHTRLYDAAKRDRTWAFVSAGVGTAGVVAAAAWWWRAMHAADSRAEAAARVTALPTPVNAGMALDVAVTW
jgi:hypothetical protein